MIDRFGKLACGGSDAGVICDIDLQKGRFPAFLRDLIRSLATGVRISRTDKDLKPCSYKQTGYLIANPSIRPCDQRCLHARRFDITLVRRDRRHSHLPRGPPALAVDWTAIPPRHAIFS